VHLGQVVDREEVRLADLDHRREAVRLQVVVPVLVAGQEAERDAVVREALGAAAPFEAVDDGVLHPLGHVGHPRHQVLEELLAAALGLHHRELHHHVRPGQERVDHAAQVQEVLARHHRVDREVEPPSGEVAHRRVGLLEGIGADERVVDLGRAATVKLVDVVGDAFVTGRSRHPTPRMPRAPRTAAAADPCLNVRFMIASSFE
jgi:hypothetical protein